RGAPSGAAGVHRARRLPVRLLHPGSGHVDRRAPARGSVRARGRREARGVGQPLPLRRVREHRRRGRRRFEEDRDEGALMAGLRVLKSKDEFEGEIYESTVIVEGRDLTAPADGAPGTEIGRPRPRVDGRQRVSGTATYTQDVQLAGMLHALILRSPYPRARVRAVDTKKADALPGVRGILHRFNTPEIEFRAEKTLFREEVRFVGDDVAAVVAD